MQAWRPHQENCILLPSGLGIVFIREATLEYIIKRYYSIREAMPKPIGRDQRNIFFGFGIVSWLFLLFFFLSHFAFALTIYLYIYIYIKPMATLLAKAFRSVISSIAYCFCLFRYQDKFTSINVSTNMPKGRPLSLQVCSLI